MALGTFDGSDREKLSALADGELADGDRAALCAAWANDAAARRDWHAWHLIGDVLRSEDLASDPRRDSSFCAGVRARLAREPVVLAPRPLEASRRPRWAVGSAVAAGVVLVVGTFIMVRPGDRVDAPVLAEAARRPAVVAVADPLPQPARNPADEPIVVDARLIRDAQLDRYLAAHKQFAGTSALGVPSAFLRSATVDSAPR